MAWIPPYAAHVPAATTANAFGASRSIQVLRVIGWPVRGSLPMAAQYPSALISSLGIDPSITRTNGASSRPSAASCQTLRYSSPPSE